MNLEKAYYNSPLGFLEITGNDDGIQTIKFVEDELTSDFKSHVIQNCIQQLDEYFNDQRTEFSIKLNPQGTDFQKEVWKQLVKIPFGITVSYLHVAKSLGDRNKTRVVGNANGKNPVPIIIPCHRVIGANGKLVGYAGGIHRKEWLLKFEARQSLGGLFA